MGFGLYRSDFSAADPTRPAQAPTRILRRKSLNTLTKRIAARLGKPSRTPGSESETHAEQAREQEAVENQRSRLAWLPPSDACRPDAERCLGGKQSRALHWWYLTGGGSARRRHVHGDGERVEFHFDFGGLLGRNR